jgi:putative transposase
MDEYESLGHSKWACKYHVGFIPKCQRKTFTQSQNSENSEI